MTLWFATLDLMIISVLLATTRCFVLADLKQQHSATRIA
jgi:hypothetical protein